MRFLALLLLAACGSSAEPAEPDGGSPPDGGGPAWLVAPTILVKGVGVDNTSCRDAVCQHNENTDLIAWKGAIYLVHRTAISQILGPNSSLRVYRSNDNGATFDLQAILPAPSDRDLRDPCF